MLGDKLLAAVNEDTGIVRKIVLTPASRHEHSVAEAVVQEDVGVWRSMPPMMLTRCAIITKDTASSRRWSRTIRIRPTAALAARGEFRREDGTTPREPLFGTLTRTSRIAQAHCLTLAHNLVNVIFKIPGFNLSCAITLADAG